LIPDKCTKNSGLKKVNFQGAEKRFSASVINKKNIYQQIDFTAFAMFKIDTFVREIQ